jgi:alkylation response protein AidB-like acyl-CoA dehydrogenase
MSSFLTWWHRQSKKAQIAMAATTVLGFFVLIGALGSIGGDGKTEASSPPAQQQESPKTKQQSSAKLAAQRAEARAARARARAAKIAKAKARARRAARRKAAAAKAAAAKAAAAKAAAAKAAAAKAAAAKAAEASRCHPSYRGACLDPNASDYDCEGGSGNGPEYTGFVRVIGPDEYGLDADGDGSGCE